MKIPLQEALNYNKMRKITALLILLCGFYSAWAYLPIDETISRDSLRTKWANGKKFLMHKVQKGETFYSLSRDYKVEVKELMNVNKGVTTLKTGQIIQIPVSDVASPQTAVVEKEEVKTVQSEEKNQIQQEAATKAEKDTYHTVKKGETLSAIAQKYKVSVTTLQQWNNLKSKQVNINQKLIVKKGAAQSSGSVAQPKGNKSDSEQLKAAKYHTVKKGETLYGIARQYSVSAAELTDWNQLNNSGIKTGQQLIVAKATETTALSAEPVRTKTTGENEVNAPKDAATETKVSDVKTAAEEKAVTEETTNAAIVSQEVIDKTPSGKNIKQSIETGEAAWVNDADLNPSKYFALHRTAPIGTIMKVTNRMNGKYVFVKVIGKLPGTGDNEKLIIKISKAAADRLGVIDPTFQCELNYAFASEN